jgi:CheY-like chemotaxis protein
MQPSLILLDTTMPRMDGNEVCTKLRGDECGRTIPVIMLTANSLKADRALALTVGADDWVTKPSTPPTYCPSQNTDRARSSGMVARDRQCSLANAVLSTSPWKPRLDTGMSIVGAAFCATFLPLGTTAGLTIGPGDEPKRHGQSRSWSEYGRMAGKVEAWQGKYFVGSSC